MEVGPRGGPVVPYRHCWLPPRFVRRWAPGADLSWRPVTAGFLLAWCYPKASLPARLHGVWPIRARTSLTLGTEAPCTLISQPGEACVGGVGSQGTEACVSSSPAVLVVQVAGFLCSVLAWLWCGCASVD